MGDEDNPDHWKQMVMADNPDWPSVLSAQICELFEAKPTKEGLTVAFVKHNIPHGGRFMVREVQAELDRLVEQGWFRHNGEPYGRLYFMD